MRPLRVGAVFDPHPVLEDWEIRLLRRIAEDEELELAGLYLLPRRPRLRRPNRALAFALALERQILPGSAGRVSRLGVLDFGKVPVLSVADAADLPGDGVDVILSHLRGVWSPAPSASPEIWGYSALVEERHAPSLSGIAEVCQAAPTTDRHLLRKTRRSVEVVASVTTNAKLTASLTSSYANDAFVSAVIRALRRRRREGATRLLHAGYPPRAATATGSLGESVSYAAAIARAAGRRLFSQTYRRLGGRAGDWALFLGRGDVLTSPLDDLAELPQPRGEFRADPFVLREGDATYVFFEAYRHRSRRGGICAGRLEGGALRDVVEIDLGPIHVSYPYVFRDGGSIYMIPETHQRERVEVWRCTRLPDRWVLHATALEGQSPADSVLIKHRGRWWLFTNISAGAYRDHCNELHLFQVDGPDLRVLVPHVDNPVVIDGTRARMGGRPFERDGVLFRPAQITSHGIYGHGMKLMRVTKLSPTEYEETVERTIEPDRARGASGCHHVDAAADFFVLDARRAYGTGCSRAPAISLMTSPAAGPAAS